MVTLEFCTLPKVTVPDGSLPIPKARLEINNPSAKQEEVKDLVPLTLKTGKIMWVHSDLAQDKQWDSKKPKSKGKSYNVISVLLDDDNVTIAFLSDSKSKRHTFTAQAVAPHHRYSIWEIIPKTVRENYWRDTTTNDVNRNTCSGFSPDTRKRKAERSPIWPRLEETLRPGTWRSFLLWYIDTAG